MRRAIVIADTMTGHKLKEEIEIYSIEEVRNYPNISKAEIRGCEGVVDLVEELGENMVGFALNLLNEEEVEFVQIYDHEVLFKEEI